MMTKCELCDAHGPELNAQYAKSAKLHRGVHALKRELEKPLIRIVDWMARRVT